MWDSSSLEFSLESRLSKDRYHKRGSCLAFSQFLNLKVFLKIRIFFYVLAVKELTCDGFWSFLISLRGFENIA